MKFAVLCGYGIPKSSQVIITNIIMMKKFEILENYQTVTQELEVNKCCLKMTLIDLPDAGLPQTFTL